MNEQVHCFCCDWLLETYIPFHCINVFVADLIVLKREPQTQLALLVLKPKISNLDLISDLTAVSASPRNTVVINSSRIFWSCTCKLICQVSPLYIPHSKRRRGNPHDKTLAIPFPVRENVLV